MIGKSVAPGCPRLRIVPAFVVADRPHGAETTMEASCQVKPADRIAVHSDTQLNVSTGYPKTPQAIDLTARGLARRLISRAGAATG